MSLRDEQLRSFHDKGFAIVEHFFDEREVAAMQAEAAEAGWHADVLFADITETDAPAQIIDHALELYGGLNGCVNNAGVGLVTDSAEVTDEQFDTLMAVNIRAMFRLSRAAYSALEASQGAIVNIGSINSRATAPSHAVYAASKGAVESLTRGMALDYGPQGVRVNCVLPGLVIVIVTYFFIPILADKPDMPKVE